MDHTLGHENHSVTIKLDFYGGVLGAMVPFTIFLIGIIFIALSGAPDEKGFWPILILSLTVGLILCKNRKNYSEAVINGMSQRIVMIMIMAWMLASIIGVLMTETGFVEALTWVMNLLNLGSTGFVIATLIICCLVSLSTGSSFATILICGPLLYPAGGLLGAHLPTLAGAIIGGATFGDFTAPISDTTIASALSQKADIGQTVKSRIKYIVPAIATAMGLYIASAIFFGRSETVISDKLISSPSGLPMLIAPIFIIWLFLKGKHLVHGLLLGLFAGVLIGLLFGLLPIKELLSLDLENFVAHSFVITGINRAVGISFFTILLMGLVETIRASGIMKKLIDYASSRNNSTTQSEWWIAGSVASAVLLTTHSIVAILMVSDFVNKSSQKLNLSPIRRANILSLVVCVLPFVLPYFIPVILMANMTTSGSEFGIESVTPLQVGLFNFVGWALLLITVLVVSFGYGRNADNTITST